MPSEGGVSRAALSRNRNGDSLHEDSGGSIRSSDRSLDAVSAENVSKRSLFLSVSYSLFG